MVRAALALVLVLLPSSWARAETPWEQLMGRKPKLWNDPAGRFQLDLPLGWAAHASAGEGPVTFVRQRADDGAILGQVQVELRPLPPGVAPAHFDAHVQRDNEKNAPGYRVSSRRKVAIGGATGIETQFRYRAHGHAQLGREVVQTVFVIGERGYVMTLETLIGARGLVWDEFQLMRKGFSVRGGGPTVRTPSGRRRVKAGEMINPDAVGY